MKTTAIVRTESDGFVNVAKNIIDDSQNGCVGPDHDIGMAVSMVVMKSECNPLNALAYAIDTFHGLYGHEQPSKKLDKLLGHLASICREISEEFKALEDEDIRETEELNAKLRNGDN